MTMADGGAKTPFNPAEVAIISEAYRRALAMLGGDAADGGDRADLARHVVELARGGELDLERLCRRAAMAARQIQGTGRLTAC